MLTQDSLPSGYVTAQVIQVCSLGLYSLVREINPKFRIEILLRLCFSFWPPRVK